MHDRPAPAVTRFRVLIAHFGGRRRNGHRGVPPRPRRLRPRLAAFVAFLFAAVLLVQVSAGPAAPGVFSLDRLRLGSATGSENYLYTGGDVIVPEGGVDAGRFYRFVVTAPGGAIRNSPSCRPSSDFPTANNTYTVQANDPASTATAWRYTLEQYTTPGCTGAPAKTTFKSFFVAKATAYSDAALKTSRSGFRAGQTAFVAVDGLKPGTTAWNVTWLLPSGAVACANTAGSERPASRPNGILPKGGDGYLQYRPNTTATGSAWNREANYEARPCPTFGSGNQGKWKLRLQLDATTFVVMPVFDVDTAPPAPPSIDSRPATRTASTSATFGFSDPESNVTFLCSIDTAAFAPCASPAAYANLSGGSHGFRVKALDSAGNESSTTSYSWIVDTAPPAAPTLDSHPQNPSRATGAGFAFSGEAGATYLCRLDAAVFAPCTSPVAYTGLTDGAHGFQLKAVDDVGNESTVVSFFWVVDTTAPVVALVSPAHLSQTDDSTPLLSGSAGSDTGDADTVTVEVYAGTVVSGVPLQTLTAPRAAGSFAVDAAPLANGTYTARAQQADAAGNVGASGSSTFEVDVGADTAAPVVTLTSPVDGATTADATPSFVGVAGTEAGDSDTVTVEVYTGGAIAGAPVQTLPVVADSLGLFAVDASPALGEGTYTARAEQRDTAGNVGHSAPVTLSVDTTPPAAPTLDSQPQDPSSAATATFAFSHAEATVAFRCRLDGGAFAGCSSPASYGGLTDGAHTFVVKARDAAGNEGAVVSYSWVVDKTAPAVALVSPAHLSTTNDATPLFSGSAGSGPRDSDTVTVKLYAGTVASGAPLQTLTAPRAAGSFAVDSSPLADGAYTARAEQADAAGNVGQSQTHTFTVDTTSPILTLTQPANGSTTSTSTPIFSGAAGTATGDATGVTVRVYAGAEAVGTPVLQVQATRSGGTWSVTAPAALADGTYTARADQADTAGNVGQSAPSTFNVAASAPPGTDYRAAVLSDAPRAYWRLGEAAGTAAADETSNGIAGTYLNGVTLGQAGVVSGDSNSSIGLDGVNDTVRVPNVAALNSSTAMSLELWINVAALPSTSATLARKEGQSLLRLTSTGNIVFRLWKGGAITEVGTANGTVTANAWHHIVATWDGATMRIYVNGTVRASRSLAGPVDVTTADLYLGSSYNSYDRYGGKLDEVAVYAAALPEARINAHYTTANPAPGGGGGGGPTVSLMAPANGSTSDATPNFGGLGGTGAGDVKSVVVKIYGGSGVSGPVLQTRTASVQSAGTFSVKAAALPSGTYTAVAEQSDVAGHIGRSDPSTFNVDAAADPVLLAAGDIAGCGTFGDEATAALLDRLPGTVVPVGDLVYEDGTAQEFADCYDPTWGRHKARTRPVVNGHEYRTPGAVPYYAYWGAAAGDPTKGYYSYDVGNWHVIALNTVCAAIGGCDAGSPEERWLRADLAANPTRCTVAFLHTPRFSSGSIHGNSPEMEPFWQALYDGGVELVVSGDDHIYERFAPQTPTGVADPDRGIREIIAGTGGRSHYGIGTIEANSEVRNIDTFGILKLTLHADSYDWQFVPEAGRTFADSGSAACH